MEWIYANELRSSSALAAGSLGFLTAVAIWLLSAVEHSRSVRPSTILCVYLLVTIAFDAVQVRTLWLIGQPLSLCVTSSISVFLKAVLLLLESRHKRKSLLEPYRSLPPEALCGILGTSFFWWLNPLMWLGYWASLSLKDLHPTGPEMASCFLDDKFDASWNEIRRGGKYRLALATLWSLRWPLLSAAFPRVCQTAFTFAQPFLIARVIDFVAGDAPEDAAVGYGLVGATALVYGGWAISVAVYKHKTFGMITMARGGLVTLVYSKTLRIDAASLQDSAAVTLISTNVQSIVTGWTNIHELWASPIEVGIAVYLLELRVGLACMAPVVIAILSTMGSTKIAALTQKRQDYWLQTVQSRVSATSAMLTKIKGLKMLNFLSSTADRIQELRLEEVIKAKSYLRVDALMNVCANASTLLSPVATLLLFTFVSSRTLDSQLTSSSAYYILNLVALMSSPLGQALNALPSLTSSLACFARIQQYLERDERQDYRLESREHITSMESPQVTRDNLQPEFSSAEAIEMMSLRPLDHAGNVLGNELAVAIDDGHFGYDVEGNAVLKDVNLRIVPRSITVVTGPVGSGKSTLLKTILAEVKCFKGFVRLRSPGIAYCGQEPWLQNQTLRDNILGGLSFDESLYTEITRSVGLTSDLAAMPQADLTVLGANGTRLSGGQAQRVALARAIYARRPLLLLDDCLSGLDSKTARFVCETLFARSGLLRRLGCTVIVTTHSLRNFTEADLYVVLDGDGRVVERQGASEMSHSRVSSPGDRKGLHHKQAEDQQEPVGSTTLQQGQQAPRVDTDLATDEASTRGGRKGVWRLYVNSIGWYYCSIYLLLNAAYVFCTRFAQIWVGWWVDAGQASPGRHTNTVYGSSYAGLQLAAMTFFGALLLYMFQIMVPRSAQSLHWTLLQTTIRANHHFHASTDPGITLNRFSQDLTLIDLDLPSYAIEYIIDVFLCIGQAIIISLGLYYIAALLPAIIPIVYFLQRYYLQTSRQIRLLDLEAKSPLFSHMLETYSGLTSLRAFGWTSRFQAHNHALLDQSQRPFYALFCIQRWLAVVLNLMVAALAVCLVAFATQFRDLTSGNAIGVALLNVVSFAQTLTQLVAAYTSLETALGAIVRIKGFTQDVKPEDDGERALLETVPEGLVATAVELKNVTISYGLPEPAVKNVSLVVRAGTRVGICGRSGRYARTHLELIDRNIYFHD